MNEIYKNSHKMPWTINDAPHGLLDIIRGCNCKCDACYNTAELKIKSFEDVIKDYETMLTVRKISSVGLIGGEPLLHPDLFKIIKYLKEQNVTVEILTNGVLLDENMAEKLAEYGVDLVFLHIDTEQKRPDLQDEYTREDADNLRTQKAKILAENNIEVAMSVTIGKSELPDGLDKYLEYFKQSPYINYFLLTLYKDLSSYGKFNGCLTNGITGMPVETKTDSPKMDDVVCYIKESKNATPYWYMPGKHDKEHPRWVSYLYAASYKKNKLQNCKNMKYSKMEENYLEYFKKKNGRYPFFKKQTQFVNFIFILFNGLYGGYFWENTIFLLKTLFFKKYLKRIFIQEPAYINKNGILEHCESCPDATVKNGKVVPVCVCDCF